MNRCKLEYMTKSLSLSKEREIFQEVDPEGKYMFSKYDCDFLKDPDTKDEDILIFIPGYRNPEKFEAYKNKFRAQYEKINKMCTDNRIYPFFENPRDIKNSEMIRQDIIKQLPEEELNKYFNVKSFREYQPPVYEPANEMGE